LVAASQGGQRGGQRQHGKGLALGIHHSSFLYCFSYSESRNAGTSCRGPIRPCHRNEPDLILLQPTFGNKLMRVNPRITPRPLFRRERAPLSSS
ncbi:hypothetical protein, partial [Achromobacter xylosoxidans]|uniref:hypothetical protein n=1 Tax=Alcaligenes xylosoxydans xylosoxydans TaxID=85698 RepID=UPI001F114FC6